MTRLIDQLFDNNGRPALICFVGKSYSGKSYFIRYYISNGLLTKKFKFGMVFTKTKFNKDYDFLPDKAVYDGYNEEALKQYISNLERMKRKQGVNMPRSFLVLDDIQGVLSDQTEFMNNFLARHRHYNITLIVAIQYLGGRRGVSPLFREQCTHAVMFKSKTKKTLENLFLAFGQLFNSLEDFKRYFFAATEQKHSAMLYTEQIDDLEDNYQTIQAPANVPKMKFKF